MLCIDDRVFVPIQLLPASGSIGRFYHTRLVVQAQKEIGDVI
jgi:hypothetical protein